MKKKVLAGILAATMVFSLAACGSTGSNSDSGSSAASGSTAKTEEEGEPYTVTMVLQGTTQPDEERIEEKINEILEPELNAKLDIVVLPWASASQQLKLMLSGDEKIDLLYTSASTAVQYMQSGQIMDMSELIDKYGTNLKDIYGEDIAKTNQIDGFVYGVPNQIERGSIPAIFMRKDLVEKYNINTDEIKNIYVAKQFCDMRKQIDDLALIVTSQFSMNVLDHSLFIFTNASRNRIKMLYYEANGFWLFTRRLENGKFKFKKHEESGVLMITPQQLNWLIEGLEFENKISEDTVSNCILI